MKLYLIQHGDAVAQEVDPDRPLSDQGEQDIERLASFLWVWELNIAQILHIGKTRARQTAEIVAAPLGLEGEPREAANLGPKDAPQLLADQLKNQSEDMAIVGHMPYLGKLASLLTTGNEQSKLFGFKPGSLVGLERDDEGRWSVICMLRPEYIKG